MAKSIMQTRRACILTGYDGEYLDKHHIFGGANRKRSERMGLWVYVRADLHRTAPGSIHQNRELELTLKKWGQRICMEHYEMSVDDFIREFGRNYLTEDGDWDEASEPPRVRVCY